MISKEILVVIYIVVVVVVVVVAVVFVAVVFVAVVLQSDLRDSYQQKGSEAVLVQSLPRSFEKPCPVPSHHPTG